RVERRRVERETHPPLGAELVDQDRMLGALNVLDQQRGPAGLGRAISDLGDLEVWIHLGGHANELSIALEQLDPRAQVGRRRHLRVSLGTRVGTEPSPRSVVHLTFRASARRTTAKARAPSVVR